MNIHDIIIANSIAQIYISRSLINHKNNLFENYNCNYSDKNKITLFWGMYNQNDIMACVNHKGKRYIYWHDTDTNINNKIRKENILLLKNVIIDEHYYSKDSVIDNLNKVKIKATKIKLNKKTLEQMIIDIYDNNEKTINVQSNINYSSLDNIIEFYDIKQIYVSSSLLNHKNGLLNKYNTSYKKTKVSTLFWGMYSHEDISHCIEHPGAKFIYWHDNDANIKYKSRIQNILNLRKVDVVLNLCTKLDVYKNLLICGINSKIINFDKVYNNIKSSINYHDRIQFIFIGKIRQQDFNSKRIKEISQLLINNKKLKIVFCYFGIEGDYEFIKQIENMKTNDRLIFNKNLSWDDIKNELSKSDLALYWKS